MIISKVSHYCFEGMDFSPITSTDFLNGHFYIELPEIKAVFEEDKVLLSVGNALIIRLIKRSYDDADTLLLKTEGCFLFNEENEHILEAELNMQTPSSFAKDKFYVRLPLSAPFAKNGKIGLYFDGTWIRFMKDGEVLNENSGMARFNITSNEVYVDEAISGAVVSGVKGVTVTYRDEARDGTPAFLFPYGWNTNIGDVMTFYHDGVYHLAYLHDRRHHGSRNWFGAHYICQFTTTDLVNWYEQKPIAEITDPWMSYGTGTMVYHEGKYYMSYGLHTERHKGDERIVVPKFNKESGEYEILSAREILEEGCLPAGASYSVSDDGINFTPSGLFVHAARNPSVYSNEKGGISCYCGYTGDGVAKSSIFESDGFGKPFKIAENNLDFVNDSIMGNTSECPALFTWNGYKYILVGFSGYFRTLSENSDSFVDAAALGEYIYDGLSVPMVTEFKDNRRLIAGWIRSPIDREHPDGWGGAVLHRELVFEEGGKLGMKWIPELAPIPQSENLICGNNLDGVSLDTKESYYLELNINPLNAKRMGFSFTDGVKAFTAELDFAEKRVQINNADYRKFGEKLETVIEQMKKLPKGSNVKRDTDGNIPQNAVNFALSDIPGTDKPFTVKMVIRHSRRLRCAVLDIEIAQRRTLISVREGFFPNELSVISEGRIEVTDAKLYTISSAE